MSPTEIKQSIIAGIVMLAVAGFFVLTGVLTGIHRKKVAATYLTTQALVTRVTARTSNVESGLTNRAETVTSFRVSLEYTAGGLTYKISRKSRWDLGEHTTVYYDPDNPNKVYTEEQVLGRYFASWYIIAGIVGALGLSVVIFVLTQTGKAGT